MNLKFAFQLTLFILSCAFYCMSALASTFENMEGIYKILSCKNDATNPSPWDLSLCDNTLLTIHPSPLGTSFEFSKMLDAEAPIRPFSLPSNMATHPNGKYTEKGDYFAAFTNDDKGSGEIFVMRKNMNRLYHLSMHRRSDLFKTFDMFEVDLEKIMDHVDPLPGPTRTKLNLGGTTSKLF